MPIIEINHVTKEYQLDQLQSLKTTALNQWRRLTSQPIEERAPFKALDDVNFSAEQGAVLFGIIGTNRSVESAMLNLLANTLIRHVNHYQGSAARHSKLQAGPHQMQ